NPSPYMYFVRHPAVSVVGSSPEPMVQLLDGRVISRPIAGTRPRGETEIDDRRLAGELSEHPKELAEHVMLVDLARNDVGRVVRYFDFSGNLDTAIAIRTMFVAPDGRASVQAGAGIVADSDPEAEDAECRAKASALLAAVPAARRMRTNRVHA